jgi:hypothetical protein
MRLSVESGHAPTWAANLPREDQVALLAYHEAVRLKKVHANQDAMMARGAS